MISKLNIKNFKSIKELELDCRRVNLFIGEPNTGKSNILESLGMMSMIHGKTGTNQENSIKDYVRGENMTNLYYNNIVDDDPITVNMESSLGNDILTLTYINSEYEIICSDVTNNKKLIEAYVTRDFRNNRNPQYSHPQVSPIRFYKYKERLTYPSKEIDFLNPPDGNNFVQLVQNRKNIKDFVLDLFSKYGYKYQGFDDMKKIYFNIDFKGELIPLPFQSLSDTLLRLIFYYTAIELSNEAVLVFEEPDEKMFPYYTQQLAEKVGKNNTNQFFMATHNPYFLYTLMEKTPKDELAIFVTYYTAYQTHTYKLTNDEISEFMDSEKESMLFQIKDLADELIKGTKK